MKGRGRLYEFEASLHYRVSSRTVRATQSNPVSNINNNKIENKEFKFYSIDMILTL